MLKTLTSVSFRGSRFSDRQLYVSQNWVYTKMSVEKREAVLNNSIPFTLTLFLDIRPLTK